MTLLTSGTPHERRRFLLSLAAVAIVAVAVIPYLWVLRLPLTAVDTIPTVATARLDSVRDLPALLLRELRGGADPTSSYYRPLTLVTYSIDFAFWHWSAFGYQLTDLLLHALAALAVFAMALLAFDRRPIWAFLVTVIFLFHPATIEVVPAVARREEPLLVIGIALALIGARLLPTQRGRLLMLLGTLVAVTSVERGLVTPGIIFVYLLFYHPKTSGIPRARTALAAALPSFLLAGSFYLLHRLLFALPDEHFAPRNLVEIPTRFFGALLYPQQIIDFRAPDSPASTAAWVLLGATTVGALLWSLWRSREMALAVCGALFAAGYCALFAVAGQFHPWYIYTATPALGLIVVALCERGAGQLARAGATRLRGAVSLLAGISCLIAVAWPSPLLRHYEAWRVAGQLSEDFLAQLAALTRSLPASESLVIFNLPASFAESNSDYLVTRSAAILWPRSVESWARVNHIPNPVCCLGASRFVGAVGCPTVEFTAEGHVRVSFAAGASALIDPENRRVTTLPRGFEFAWPPPELKGRPVAAFLFDGQSLVSLAVHAAPRGDALSRAMWTE